MTTRHFLNRKLVFMMAGWALWMGTAPGRVWAMPSGSLSVVQTPSAVREAQIQGILNVLSRPAAQLHLKTMGMTLPQLRDKLAQLDDAQLAQVAKKSDAVVKAAGQAEVIIAILVIAILFVILIYLLNKDIQIKDKD